MNRYILQTEFSYKHKVARLIILNARTSNNFKRLAIQTRKWRLKMLNAFARHAEPLALMID